MTFNVGSRIGSYEVVTLIGAGGMGEVYRARDSRLQRDVAVKVLPTARRLDPESLRRFEREARLLASLNHPNIATLHGFEASGDVQALIMEFVEGVGLDDKLAAAAKALPLDEALDIARQIADALDTAHECGVIHRDLKPANIRIRSDGTVKVLDFGIAKAFEPRTGGQRGVTVTATAMQGAIVGSPAYMSPEQATGGLVDRRSDIWAFGCVLYEMLTGARAFDGETPSSVLARVLEREPDWDHLPQRLPPSIRVLLRQCLEKNPRERRRDAGDLRLDLVQMRRQPSLPAIEGTATGSRKTRHRSVAAAAAVFVVAVVALGLLQFYAREPASAVTAGPARTRLVLEIDDVPSSDPFAFALSPDGTQLTFVVTFEGKPHLWIRRLDTVEPYQRLMGTEGATGPFWSPDSSAIAFFADSKLRTKDLLSGATRELADAPAARGGTWNRAGDILYAPETNVGLMRVSAKGGPATPVTTLAPDHGSHRWPQFLPDGRRFLFFVSLGKAEVRGTYLGSLDRVEPARLLGGDTNAIYAPPDYLLQVVNGALIGHRFDLEGATVGDQLTIVPAVGSDYGAFRSVVSVSNTGRLAYRTGEAFPRQLDWLSVSGAPRRRLASNELGVPSAPELSIHGQVAVMAAANGRSDSDIWIFDAAGRGRRLTSTTAVDAYPVWSPGGDRVVFGSPGVSGIVDLFEMPVSGVSEKHVVLQSDEDKVAQDWATDGSVLLYTTQIAKNAPSDLWARRLRDKQSFPIAETEFDEGQAQFSPDDKWVAYASNDTGRHEIYIQSFPNLGGPIPVSSGGGIYPRWGCDGRALFYVEPDTMHLMTVPLTISSASLVPGESQLVFETRIATTGSYVFTDGIFARAQYDVSCDGQFIEFIMNVSSEGTTPITVVGDWTAGLTDSGADSRADAP